MTRPLLEPAVALARDALAREGRRPVVVAHDIWLAAGLQRALPETALVCISASDAIDVLRAGGTEVFCLSETCEPQDTAGMSTLDLLLHPATAAFFARLGPTAVMAFKPSEKIAAATGAVGGRLLAAPSSAARAYENKLAFVAAAERAGVPRPRWHARSLPGTFEALAADYGPKVVVQGPRGNAGQRTMVVTDQATLEAARAREAGAGQLRLAEYVAGVPFTASGVVVSTPGSGLDGRPGPATIEPCRQVTGVPWLTPEPLGSAGNAWGEELFTPHLGEIDRCVQALGADLNAHGYQGVFGVDFVLSASGPVVIEVNPRMVASLPLATELEVEAGRAPLLLLHLLEMLHADIAGITQAEAPAALGTGSQVILHRLDGDAPERRPSGVYRTHGDDAVVFARPGAGLADLRAGDELLLLTRRTEEPVTTGKEFARVYTRSARGEEAPGVRALVTHARSARD